MAQVHCASLHDGTPVIVKVQRPGIAATIIADVLPGQVFHGHVVSLAPATGAQFSILPPENATGNFTKVVQRVPVRIAVPTGQPAGRYHGLLVGSTAAEPLPLLVIVTSVLREVPP